MAERVSYFGATKEMKKLRNRDLGRSALRVLVSAPIAVAGATLLYNGGAELSSAVHGLTFLQNTPLDGIRNINFDAPIQGAAGFFGDHFPGASGMASAAYNIPFVSNLTNHDALTVAAGLTEVGAVIQGVGVISSEASRRFTHASDVAYGKAKAAVGAVSKAGEAASVAHGHGSLKGAPEGVALLLGLASTYSKIARATKIAATVADAGGELATAPESPTPGLGLNDILSVVFAAVGWHPSVGRMTVLERLALIGMVPLPWVPSGTVFSAYALLSGRMKGGFLDAPLTEYEADRRKGI